MAATTRSLTLRDFTAAEVAAGRNRMDLLLTYGPDRVALELKVWAPRRGALLKKGFQQLDS
jgi:hypothetical protein